MNLEPKILLSVFAQGVLSQVKEATTINVVEEREVNNQKLTKRYEKQHFERIPGIASKKTIISQEAVDFMVSNQIPEWYKSKRNYNKTWDSLTEDEKLQQHFIRMAYPNTFSYNYIG